MNPGSHPAPPCALVCFAVPDEARPFRQRLAAAPDTGARAPSVPILVTGMGPHHAARRFLEYLQAHPTRFVLTAGFAGALDPNLSIADVLYDADPGFALRPALRAAGARPASFHCADRVATRAADKRQLRETTGADAVEMESGVIRSLCRQRGIPSATVRVISDAAGDDLPLDFNTLTGSNGFVSLPRLLARLAMSPTRLPALIRLGRHTSRAGRELARVLVAALTSDPVGPA